MSVLPSELAPSVFSPCDLAEVSPAAKSVRVGGRVVHLEKGAIIVADAFAALRIELSAPAAAPAVAIGDLVVAQGAPRPGRLARATVVEHLVPERPPGAPAAEANAPGETETARIQDGGVGRALAARAALFRVIREFFDRRHFIEVDTPALVPSPGLDVHLDAFAVEGAGYLSTSPEYQMKRLLVGGIPRCYQIARCYRNGEQGARHNREFVMLEWYRAFAGVEDVLRDTEELVRLAAQEISGGTELLVEGVTIDVGGPFERMTLAQAFERHAGVDEAQALRLSEEDEEKFFRLLVDRVEPAIAKIPRPVFVTGYPASQASLARLSPTDPRVSERFELYVGGIELCNGFGELTDPVEQRRRFERDRAQRAQQGKAVYPVDERFLRGLAEGMPPAGGNALGVDRLLALCLGEQAIGEVMSFPRSWL